MIVVEVNFLVIVILVVWVTEAVEEPHMSYSKDTRTMIEHFAYFYFIFF